MGSASGFLGWASKFRRVWAGLRGLLASPRVFVLLKVWANLGLGVGPRASRTQLRRFRVGLRIFATGLRSDGARVRGVRACWIGALLRWICVLKPPGLDLGLRLRASSIKVEGHADSEASVKEFEGHADSEASANKI